MKDARERHLRARKEHEDTASSPTQRKRKEQEQDREGLACSHQPQSGGESTCPTPVSNARQEFEETTSRGANSAVLPSPALYQYNLRQHDTPMCAVCRMCRKQQVANAAQSLAAFTTTQTDASAQSSARPTSSPHRTVVPSPNCTDTRFS